MSVPSTRRFLAALFAPLPVLTVTALAVSVVLVLPDMPAAVLSVAELAARSVGATLAALLVHDLAHWLAAYLLGFKLVAVPIGPFTVAPSRRGIHWRAARTWPDFAGALIAEPRVERRMNARWAFVAIAGPAVSLALGIATLDVAPLLAIASLVRFAIAAFPFGMRGEPGDGAQLLLLLVGGARADRLIAMQRIAAAQRAGVRPRAWPDQWIADATAIHDGTAAEALACMAAFRRAVDGCAHDRASALLDRALALRARLPRVAACALLADAAYFEARIHDDAGRAREWLDEAAARRPSCPVAERRATAAVLLAAGDFTGGAVVAREALAHLDAIEREEHRRLPMESDWLHEMLARAECASVLPAELVALPG